MALAKETLDVPGALDTMTCCDSEESVSSGETECAYGGVCSV